MHVSELDASKFAFNSLFPGFKNNRISTGSFVIGGSYAPGVNTQTFQATLEVQPDLADISFNAASIEVGTLASTIISNKWVRRGMVLVPASGGSISDLGFVVSPELVGSVLTFRCFGVTSSTPGGTLTNTTVNWRLVDYSVF